MSMLVTAVICEFIMEVRDETSSHVHRQSDALPHHLRRHSGRLGRQSPSRACPAPLAPAHRGDRRRGGGPDGGDRVEESKGRTMSNQQLTINN